MKKHFLLNLFAKEYIKTNNKFLENKSKKIAKLCTYYFN